MSVVIKRLAETLKLTDKDWMVLTAIEMDGVKVIDNEPIGVNAGLKHVKNQLRFYVGDIDVTDIMHKLRERDVVSVRFDNYSLDDEGNQRREWVVCAQVVYVRQT